MMTPVGIALTLTAVGLVGYGIFVAQLPAPAPVVVPRSDEHTGFPSNEADVFQPSADSNEGKQPDYSTRALHPS